MRTASLLVAALIAVGILLLHGAPALAQSNHKMASVNPADAPLVASIQTTRLLLHLANRDYRGHRQKAVDKLELAIRALGALPLPLGVKKGTEPQILSDDLLRQAIGELKAVQAELTGRTDSAALQARLALNAAVQELQLALTVR
jgi:hypothetical protein